MVAHPHQALGRNFGWTNASTLQGDVRRSDPNNAMDVPFGLIHHPTAEILQDHGLWHVCHESRAAIKRTYGRADLTARVEDEKLEADLLSIEYRWSQIKVRVHHAWALLFNTSFYPGILEHYKKLEEIYSSL